MTAATTQQAAQVDMAKPKLARRERLELDMVVLAPLALPVLAMAVQEPQVPLVQVMVVLAPLVPLVDPPMQALTRKSQRYVSKSSS